MSDIVSRLRRWSHAVDEPDEVRQVLRQTVGN